MSGPKPGPAATSNDGRGSTYSRLGAEGLVRVGLGWDGFAGMINETTKQNKREFLRKFLCLRSVSPEVLPFNLETNTFASWGSAGVAKGGHQRYVGWRRRALGTKNA